MTFRARIYRPCSRGTVWRVLRLYAAVRTYGVSQLGRLGLGKGRPEILAQEWQGTVAQKLAICINVERALWLQESIDWLRRVGIPAHERGRCPSLEGLHPEMFGVLANAGYGLADMDPHRIADKLGHECGKLSATRIYGYEMCYLGCAFRLCAVEWPGFLKVAEDYERRA